jgi:hypothetical protein
MRMEATIRITLTGHVNLPNGGDDAGPSGGGSRRKLDMGGEGESAGVTGNMDQGEEGGNRVRLGSGGVGNGQFIFRVPMVFMS